jgi:hypothetical protein
MPAAFTTRLGVSAIGLAVLACLPSTVPASDPGAHPPHSAPSGAPAAGARPAATVDATSVDGVVGAYYASLSGPAGARRDRARYLALFAPGARVIPAEGKGHGGTMPRAFSPETYLLNVEPAMVEAGYVQAEVARRTERFGRIAQVFSTYEVRRTAGDPRPFVRGVHGFQLFFDGRRWWIASVVGQPETSTLLLPEEYLRPPPARRGDGIR